MDKFTYSIPTTLFFGAGKIEELARVDLPGKKALIVISSGTSMRSFGYLDKLCSILVDQGLDFVVYDRILPNPIKYHVMEAAALCRRAACDFVVGLGGGSSIDSAKAIAVMATNPGDYWDYVHGGSGLGKPVKNNPLPIIAVPTTAGTGTEADPWTVITNEDKMEKIGFGYEKTFPMYSVVDPELMLSVPSHLTAYQGFDAFFHAAEGWIATVATPISNLYALKSMKLLYASLSTAVHDGADLMARSDVALASMLSGMVESTSSCTSQHSMEHAMSAYFPELPHGAGLIMLSEAYFTFFAKKATPRIAAMARELMWGNPFMSEERQALDFVDKLVEMKESCGVAKLRMSDYGITKDDLPQFVKNARKTMGKLFAYDPYPLDDDDVLAIYKAAYK